MKTSSCSFVQGIYGRLLVLGMAAVFAACAASMLLPAVSNASTVSGPAATSAGGVEPVDPSNSGDAVEPVDPAASVDPSAAADIYVNGVQGYSVQFQGDKFGVEEYDGGAGQTTFYLLDSVLATPSGHGSKFTVNYMADWDGNPDVAQYLDETLFGAQMSDPDSFVQMTADPYEVLQAGDAAFPTVSWVRTDAATGKFVLEIRAMGVIEGGGCAYFGASMAEDEILVVADAMGRAVSSFRIDPDISGGIRVTWAEAVAPATQGSPVDTSPAPVPSIIGYTATEKTDGYSYYIQVPAEWTGFTEFGGYGESSLVEAFDYFDPAVRMTFWGLQEIPGTDFAAQMAGVPLVMPGGTVADFVGLLPDLSYLAWQSGQLGMPDETRVLSVEILDVDRVSAVTDALAQVGMSGMVTDESIVTARMILDDGNNTEVTALIYGTVAATGLGDFLSYSVMNVYGIFAPPDVFGEVAHALAESGCGRFALYDAYMQGIGAEFDAVIYANSYQEWHDYILSNW